MFRNLTSKNVMALLLGSAVIYTIVWLAVFKIGLRVPVWLIKDWQGESDSFLFFLLAGCMAWANFLACITVLCGGADRSSTLPDN